MIVLSVCTSGSGGNFLLLRRYVKFDTFHPAVEKGLPVTRVISRVVLQQILAEACMRVAGEGVILNDCRVVDYEETVRPSHLSPSSSPVPSNVIQGDCVSERQSHCPFIHVVCCCTGECTG